MDTTTRLVEAAKARLVDALKLTKIFNSAPASGIWISRADAEALAAVEQQGQRFEEGLFDCGCIVQPDKETGYWSITTPCERHGAVQGSCESQLRRDNLTLVAEIERLEQSQRGGDRFNEGLEVAAKIAEGGSFMHDEAPTARFGREVAAAIRRAQSKPAPAVAQEPPWVTVAGNEMPCSISIFDQRCHVFIEEEQNKIAPDNALIALLCDAVRLGREYNLLLQEAATPREAAPEVQHIDPEAMDAGKEE